MIRRKKWNQIDAAPYRPVERWQAGEDVYLLLRCGSRRTIGYLEVTRGGKKRWRSCSGYIIEPDGWLPLPPA